MPRQPRPFFRKQTQSWYVQIGKRQFPLGRDQEEAFLRYYHLMSGQVEAGPSLTVSRLIDNFLEWNQHNRAPRTYEWYRDFLQRFHRQIGPLQTVADLRPYHVDAWVQKDFAGQSPTTQHSAIRSIQRALNWGVKQGMIEQNPIRGMEKPTPRRREVDITEEQWDQMLELATDQAFRDVLIFFREVGCRPQELRTLEARYFDGDKFVLPLEDSKGQRYNRVLYLPPAALEVAERLVQKHKKGPIFRNSKGGPWSANALRCRFRRLNEKLKIPGLCPYATRHSFATRALKNEVDSTTVSLLMGHRDPTMVARNYQHLTQHHDHLQHAACKATNGKAKSSDEKPAEGEGRGRQAV